MHSNVRKLQIQTKSNAYECIRKLQNTDAFEYLRIHPNVRELHNSYEFQFQCEFIRYSGYSSFSQSLDSLGAGLLAWSNLQSNQLLFFVLEVGLGVKLYCTCLPGGNWVRKGDWAEEGRHLRSSRRQESPVFFQDGFKLSTWGSTSCYQPQQWHSNNNHYQHLWVPCTTIVCVMYVSICIARPRQSYFHHQYYTKFQ